MKNSVDFKRSFSTFGSVAQPGVIFVDLHILNTVLRYGFAKFLVDAFSITALVIDVRAVYRQAQHAERQNEEPEPERVPDRFMHCA